MAAVRFWDTNMTDVTSCENALKTWHFLFLISPLTIVIPRSNWKQWLCNVICLFFFLEGGGGAVRGGVEGINKVHYGLCENGEY